MEVFYNFNDPFFQKEKRYKRMAKEHLAIAEMKSDRIKWRVKEKVTHLNIPNKYEVDFFVKSIVGINTDLSPIYSNKHTVEIELPTNFPRDSFKAKTLTNIWHPNIKWEGPTKGRICMNNRKLGKSYDLYWLVLRLGEIIQYKNYWAENLPPYPEDAKVAKWILEYAEPRNIINWKKKIAVDDSNLKEYTEEKPKTEFIIKKITRNIRRY